MGQAIGTAMAYCTQHQILPNQLANQEKSMSELQQILLRQDQAILGVQNEDEKDLARQAKVKASAETQDGLAVHVIDGVNREVNDGNSHQWRAEISNEEPWIELSWDRPVRLNQVQLTFDTGLHRHLRISPQDTVYFNQERCPQPETVADYTIEAKCKDEMTLLTSVQNNYLRRVEHTFDPVEAESIRIKIQKTNVDPLARVFEVRCYLEES
jgi:hypothetical protein